jgi:stage III sporulation protein AB
MLKYAGMILIALSCTAGGFIFSNNIKNRLKQIEDFIKFFDSIINYIDKYKYPVEKIFTVYNDKNLEFFLSRLVKNGRVDGVFKNPWESSLQECADEGLIYFKDEEFKIIKEFGARLGIGRAEEQISRMKSYSDKIKNIYDGKAVEQELNLAKLYRWSGGLAGIFICILLL